MTANRLLPALALSLAVALAGCSWMNDMAFDTRLGIGSASLVDRCSDFMHRAYLGGGVTITGSHVDAGTESTAITVEAERSDVPASGIYARQIAVECRFDNGILTGFRWTLGQVRAAASPPGR